MRRACCQALPVRIMSKACEEILLVTILICICVAASCSMIILLNPTVFIQKLRLFPTLPAKLAIHQNTKP